MKPNLLSVFDVNTGIWKTIIVLVSPQSYYMYFFIEIVTAFSLLAFFLFISRDNSLDEPVIQLRPEKLAAIEISDVNWW